MNTLKKIWFLIKKIFRPLCAFFIIGLICIGPGSFDTFIDFLGVLFIFGMLGASIDSIKDSGFTPIIINLVIYGGIYALSKWVIENDMIKNILFSVLAIIIILKEYKYKNENYYFSNNFENIKLRRTMKILSIIYPLLFVLGVVIDLLNLTVPYFSNSGIWETLAIVIYVYAYMTYLVFIVMFAFTLFKRSSNQLPQYNNNSKNKSIALATDYDIEKSMNSVAAHFSGGIESISHGYVKCNTTVSVYGSNICFTISGKISINERDASADEHAETSIKNSLSSMIKKRQQRILNDAKLTLSKMNISKDYSITVNIGNIN